MLTYYTHLNKCEPSPPCDAAKAPVNAWAAWEAGLSCHETVVQPWFAKVFGGFNLLGACCHLAGIVYTLTTARLNLTMQLSDVRIKVCNPNVDNLADVRHVFRLEPVLDEPEIALGWVVVAFFALSFCFHTVAAVALLGHQFVTPLRGNRAYRLYQYGLYENMAAWRWLEYSFSASIMLIILSGTLGVREIRTQHACIGLMAVTITYGWMTDLYANTAIEQTPCWSPYWNRTFLRRWRPGSWKTRLQFHLYGYLPYTLLWVLCFRGYINAVNSFGAWFPDFLNGLVFGVFAVFTVFGVVQAVLQALPYGPSLYAYGELVYIVLSFVAKAECGFIVVEQALKDGAIYDDLLFAKFREGIETCDDWAAIDPLNG